MPLHILKFERLPDADRNDLALAALEFCRAASESDSVNSSRFYWINPNELGMIIDAEPGGWGPWSNQTPTQRAAAALFAMADLSKNTSDEVWADARAGQETYDLAHS